MICAILSLLKLFAFLSSFDYLNYFTRAGNRKQFLIADSRTIYAFVTKGEKFPTCDPSILSDKTCDVQCKVKIFHASK